MTLTILGVSGMIVVGLLVVGLVFRSGLVERKHNAPDAYQPKRRVYLRGTCPYCGEEDVVLRQDGEPSKRHHPCKLAAAPVTLPPEVV